MRAPPDWIGGRQSYVGHANRALASAVLDFVTAPVERCGGQQRVLAWQVEPPVGVAAFSRTRAAVLAG